jgi:hypothetical protein
MPPVKKTPHKHNITSRRISQYTEIYCTICGEILFLGFHVPKARQRKISGNVPELSEEERKKLI